MHKAFQLPGESSHWQYKFPLPVKVIPTARRLEMPLPEVCTVIEEMMKKLNLSLHEEIDEVDHHEKLVFLVILHNLEKCLENVLVLVLNLMNNYFVEPVNYNCILLADLDVENHVQRLELEKHQLIEE
uniref:Reverse transcriptase domain-containing protein n=1 Tax=Tanacetum cinerariifolium TaxID=118510 RepID=A0A699J474_TANCI|nr:hypothetical protein [Tanacetum cinerariifolium]